MFCSSNERKMECPPEKITMNIDKDFMQFKKENEADELRKKQKSCFDEIR